MFAATVLAWALLGQVELSGSSRSIEQATAQAHAIVVATASNQGMIMLQGCVLMTSFDLKFSATLKGRPREKPQERFGITAVGREVLPTVGESYLCFIAKQRDDDVVIKVIPRSPAAVAAIERALDGKVVPPEAEPRRAAETNRPSGPGR